MNTKYKPFLSKILKQIFMGNIRTKQSKEYFKYGFYENIILKTRDNINIGAALFKPEEVNKDTKFVIFLHGSGTNRDDISAAGQIKYFFSDNYILLIPDYRDFGDSEGEFIRENVNLDVLASFDFLINNYEAKSISVIAFSFGTAISAEYIRFILESKNQEYDRYLVKNNLIYDKNKYYITDFTEIYVPDKLILLAPFSSFPKLMSEFKLVRFLKYFVLQIWNVITDDFMYDTINNLEFYDSSKLYLLHGTHDPLIKISHSIDIKNKFKCFFKEINTDHIRILINQEGWKIIQEILNGEISVKQEI